jgi:photosystem II stability/assembly factor-like uncharacterized protein
MRASFRTFALLLAFALALIALPSVVMAAGGQSLSATVAAAFGSPVDLEQGNSPLPTPGGTVPPPTPRPIPPAPVPPRPHYPTPTPRAASPTGVTVGNNSIAKVIGDRLSSTIYAYTTRGWLYRSDLDGRSWQLVITNPPVSDFVMSAADPNVLYSGAGQSCTNAAAPIAPLYKSVDGGYTWTELPGGLDLKPLLIDPVDPDTLFAADCATIYLSTDGGETWSPKPDNAADNLWQTYAPVALASGSLVGSPQPATPHWDQIFGAGNDLQNVGVVAFSGDRGDTWANITSATDALKGVTDVEASLFEGGRLWVVDSQGVWASSDYGVNWTLEKEGLDYAIRTRTPLNDMTDGQDGTLYLATGFGLFMQEAPGEAWVRPDRNEVSFSTEKMLDLLVTETNPRRLWINAEQRNGDPIVFTMVID